MSRLYFHSPSGEAELHGSEHALLGNLVRDIAIGVLALDNSRRADRIADLIDPAYGLGARPDGAGFQTWARSVETALRVAFSREPLTWRGRAIASGPLLANTALAVGSDPVRLATRLYWQCEIHAWVDGPNRAWLADLMQQGVDAGVFRAGFPFRGLDDTERWSHQGWDDVMAVLRSRDDEPVVTSYSGCNGFPNPAVANWTPEGQPEDPDSYGEWVSDEWGKLDDATQWSLAIAGLRADPGGLEMRPDNWATFRFRHCLTVFDLFARDRDARLDAAFGITQPEGTPQ